MIQIFEDTSSSLPSPSSFATRCPGRLSGRTTLPGFRLAVAAPPALQAPMAPGPPDVGRVRQRASHAWHAWVRPRLCVRTGEGNGQFTLSLSKNCNTVVYPSRDLRKFGSAGHVITSNIGLELLKRTATRQFPSKCRVRFRCGCRRH